MPYDAEIAERVRAMLSGKGQVREVKMFGGLAFMLDERMVVCVSGGGGDLLVRVAPDRDADLVSRPGARRAQMGNDRSMGQGWITVGRQFLAREQDLRSWLDVALDFHSQGSGKTKPKRARQK